MCNSMHIMSKQHWPTPQATFGMTLVTAVTFREPSLSLTIIIRSTTFISGNPQFMRKWHVLVLFLVFSYCFGPTGMAHSQQSSTEATRKVVRRVDPTYPQMAKRMNLTGTVRVFAVVAPDGTVKAVEPVGGSPLLVQAAQDAINRWKFVPATSESKELIELHFRPE